MWQPPRAARSNRPNTPSDGSKTQWVPYHQANGYQPGIHSSRGLQPVHPQNYNQKYQTPNQTYLDTDLPEARHHQIGDPNMYPHQGNLNQLLVSRQDYNQHLTDCLAIDPPTAPTHWHGSSMILAQLTSNLLVDPCTTSVASALTLNTIQCGGMEPLPAPARSCGWRCGAYGTFLLWHIMKWNTSQPANIEAHGEAPHPSSPACNS